MPLNPAAEIKRRLLDLEGSSLGRELIAFAKEQNISIAAVDSSTLDSDPTDIFLFQGRASADSGTIQINITDRQENELLLTIVHELRHIWQNRVAGIDNLRLDAKREWLQDRYKEADAFAFQIHFAYEYSKETGKPFVLSRTPAGCEVLMALPCMLEKYTALRDTGAPLVDAYAALVADAFTLVRVMDYDRDFLDAQRERWQGILMNPELGRPYERIYRDPSSNAEFVETVHRMFTLGLQPDRDPQGLVSWRPEDFLSLERTAGVSFQNLSFLDEIIDLQQSAMSRYFQQQGVEIPLMLTTSKQYPVLARDITNLRARPILP